MIRAGRFHRVRRHPIWHVLVEIAPRVVCREVVGAEALCLVAGQDLPGHHAADVFIIGMVLEAFPESLVCVVPGGKCFFRIVIIKRKVGDVIPGIGMEFRSFQLEMIPEISHFFQKAFL